MKSLTYFFAAILFLEAELRSFAPDRLIGLVEASDVIVAAKVLQQKSNDDFYPFPWPWVTKSPASLSIEHVLKGQASTNQILVHFEPLLCPPSPRFLIESNVIAFLKKRSAGDFGVVGLSYGVWTVSDSEILSYRRAIPTLVTLQAEAPQDTKKITQWIVDQCSDPNLRNSVAHELGWTEAYGIYRFFGKLTPLHYSTLSNIVFSEKRLVLGNLELLYLFEKRAKRKVVQHLVECLRYAKESLAQNPEKPDDAREDRWFIHSSIGQILDLLPDRKAKQLWEKWSEADDLNQEDQLKLINELLPAIEGAAKAKGLL